jgi:peptidoglycan/LPS O-acetylase OafA/YrhL
VPTDWTLHHEVRFYAVVATAITDRRLDVVVAAAWFGASLGAAGRLVVAGQVSGLALRLGSALLDRLGDVSYSVYLGHPLVPGDLRWLYGPPDGIAGLLLFGLAPAVVLYPA